MRPKMFTVSNAGQANTPSESTNALTLCQEFFSLKMLCFFQSDDQKQMHWSKNLASVNLPHNTHRDEKQKWECVVAKGQTRWQLKLLLRDTRQWDCECPLLLSLVGWVFYFKLRLPASRLLQYVQRPKALWAYLPWTGTGYSPARILSLLQQHTLTHTNT